MKEGSSSQILYCSHNLFLCYYTILYMDAMINFSFQFAHTVEGSVVDHLLGNARVNGETLGQGEGQFPNNVFL